MSFVMGWRDPVAAEFAARTADIAGATGLPDDQVRFVTLLLAGYVAAFVQALLPGHRPTQNVFSLLAGFYGGWLMYGVNMRHTLLSAAAAYAVMRFAPRRVGAYIVFVGMMAHVLALHVYRMYTDYMGWHMDVTGSQMLITLKVTAFAFAYRDGALKDDGHLSPWQRRNKLVTLPGPLDYFGWVFSYLGFLAGPIIDYSDYSAYVDRSMFARCGGRPPFFARLWATGVKLTETAACYVCMTVISTVVPPSMIEGRLFRHDADVVTRFAIMWFTAMRARFQYYFAWRLSNGSTVLAGLAYDAETGRWDKGTNVRILQCETAQNIKSVTDGWNLGVDRWLKEQVYIRLQSTPYKGLAVQLTLLTSAIWHGTYPGYYMAFCTAGLLIELARMGRRVCRPFFMQADGQTPTALKPLYDLVTFVGHTWIFNYTMMPFMLLGFDNGKRFWAAWSYSGHIAIVGGLVLFTLLGGRKRPPRPDPTKVAKLKKR